MHLINFSYKDYNWAVSNLDLQIINLIVGKNGTGKTRTLYHIDLLVKMIAQKRDIVWGGQWIAEFKTHSDEVLKYELSTKASGEVSLERLFRGGKILLERHLTGECEIFSETTRRIENFTPPTNELALYSRRDIRAFAYIEKIIEWANSSFGFRFGNISPDHHEFDLLTAVQDIPYLFSELNANSKTKIVDEFNKIGFNISDIKSQNRASNTILYVHERGIDKPIPHTRLSQGMMRALSLMIFVEYLISRKNPATIIVDDLGEGLDYIRAKDLGQFIFNECKNNEVQLIATTNDSFLMDVIDIDCWNVLQRDGKLVSSINIANNPKLFEEFRYTGLSRFDFFSSDYIDSHL
ncbi:MAG: ATP-binding protein [Arcicella sp.]|nr:ATP-binding protein [Arcicella sp.]